MSQKLRQDISIGRTIQNLRLKATLTQEQVAAQMQVLGCNISRSAYSQIELGKYSIRISELMALKKIFHVQYEAFFTDLPK